MMPFIWDLPQMADICNLYGMIPKRPKHTFSLCLHPPGQNIQYLWCLTCDGKIFHIFVSYPKRAKKAIFLFLPKKIAKYSIYMATSPMGPNNAIYIHGN